MSAPDSLRPLAGTLSGLRVLDLSQNLPGPYCTMLLSSLGADVVKVEPLRGEPARQVGRVFALVNRGKRSIRLDLKSETGLETLQGLLREADVLVEGFRPGVMQRFGASARQALEANPRLIYCSISGLGQEGPACAQPGHDLNFQAMTGVCHMMRLADDTPAVQLADRRLVVEHDRFCSHHGRPIRPRTGREGKTPRRRVVRHGSELGCIFGPKV